MNGYYQFVETAFQNRDYRLATFSRPSGPNTVVYLHGLGGSKADFFPAVSIPSLQDFSLIGIDIPGCGQSGYFDDLSLNLHDVTKIIHQALSKMGINRFSLIAHSFSGIIALLFLKQYPDMVSKLINVEGNLAPEDCYIFSREVCTFPFLGHEEEYFALLRKKMLDSHIEGYRTYAETFRANVNSPRAWLDYCRSIVDCSDCLPLLEQFIGLPIPTMFMHGSENSHLSYLSRLRNSTVKVAEVPNSNHFTAYSNPDFHYRCISDFLNSEGTLN